AYDKIDIEHRLLGIGLLRERTDAPDHRGGSIASLDDRLRAPTRFLELRGVPVEPLQAGLRLNNDGSERLVHFVGERSSQLTQSRDTRDMRELSLSSVQLLLGLFSRGDIHQCPNEFQIAGIISDSMSNNMNVFDRAIRHQQSIFAIEIFSM